MEDRLKLELLQLAHECLSQAYFVARENKQMKWDNLPKGAEPTPFPSLGKYPTPDEIIAAAEKFKNFVL